MMKRALAFVLCLFLMLTAGCRAPAGGQAEFDALMTELLPALVDTQDFTSRYYFLHPEEAGLEEAGSSFSVVSEEDWEASFEETRRALASLAEIDEAQLQAENRLDLEIIKDALERSLVMEDFYLLACGGLGIESDAAQLATLAAHTPYQKKEDLEALFAMYETLPAVFSRLVEMEKERQQQGAGMTRSEIDLALEAYDRLLAHAEELGEDIITAAPFLTDEEKEAYLKKNAEAVAAYLIPAYTTLRDALSQMTGRDGVPGLAGRKNGSRYYLALLESMGVDETPEALAEELAQAYETLRDELSGLTGRIDAQQLMQFLDAPEDYSLMEGAAAKEISAWQREAVRQVFPAAEVGEVDVVLTPEVLREPNTVAYYILAPLDEAPSVEKRIYINDEETAGDFLVLAHEGFPGHLYQDMYAASQSRQTVRRLVERSYSAALEGWGVYSSLAAAELLQDNKEMALLAALLDLGDRLIAAYADIALNYFGWTLQELEDNLAGQFGMKIPGLKEFAEVLCAMPGSYLAYGIGGLRLLKMRQEAQNALGEAYTAASFHQAVLDVLPASLSHLEEAVHTYIRRVQERKAA